MSLVLGVFCWYQQGIIEQQRNQIAQLERIEDSQASPSEAPGKHTGRDSTAANTRLDDSK